MICRAYQLSGFIEEKIGRYEVKNPLHRLHTKYAQILV